MNTPDTERGNLPSASGVPRIVYCNGSREAEAAFQIEEDESDVGASGSAIHAAMEFSKTEGLDVAEKDIVENLTKLEREAIDQWAELHGIDATKVTIYREVRMWIHDRKTGKPIASAKPDVVVISECGQHMLVIDLKTGFLAVTGAEENWQLRTQAIAAWHEHPEVHTIRTAIAQHRFGSKYDYCDYSKDSLFVSEHELKFYLKLSENPHAPRVPGSWCRYCKARGTEACPESKAYALIPSVMAPITKKDEAVVAVSRLTTQQLVAIHERKTLIEAILDAVKARLKAMPKEELASVGLFVTPAGSNRTLPKIQNVWEVLKASNYLTPGHEEEEFRDLCGIGIGKVEELIVPRIVEADKCTVAEAKIKAGKLLAAVIVPEPRAGQLKPLKK